jgi:hypothetical protein
MTKDKAMKLRSLIEQAAVSLPDKEASEGAELFPCLDGDGSLVKAGTRINWNGTVKKSAVDLWDTEANDPDHAPTLWVDIDYVDGVRKIPVTDSGIFDATLAFSDGEDGYSSVDGMIYTSKVNGNVYTPQLVPTNWTLKK